MLTIRSAQLAVMEQAAVERFVEALVAHARAEHGAAVRHLDDPALRARVARAVDRARRHGLTDRAKIAFFVALALEIGPSFDRHPRIRRLLRRGPGSPEARLERVARLPSAVWAEARTEAEQSGG